MTALAALLAAYSLIEDAFAFAGAAVAISVLYLAIRRLLKPGYSSSASRRENDTS